MDLKALEQKDPMSIFVAKATMQVLDIAPACLNASPPSDILFMHSIYHH